MPVFRLCCNRARSALVRGLSGTLVQTINLIMGKAGICQETGFDPY